MGKKIGVILAGCGVMDGSEIHESVLTILALDRGSAETIFLSPFKKQAHVMNHLEGKEADGEIRSIPVESARIARGKVFDITGYSAADLDGIVFPGGFGAAKNLCDFASKGDNCTVDTEVSRLIIEMHEEGKPMGFICIAPVIIAKVLGHLGVSITIGSDKGTASKVESMGARHKIREVHEIEVDLTHKIITTPAYMLGPGISDIEKGISKLITKLLEMA